MKPKNIKILISILITVTVITTGVIFWRIAKDEIFYLCGNFSSGVTKSSVVRQLETANLSAIHTLLMKTVQLLCLVAGSILSLINVLST